MAQIDTAWRFPRALLVAATITACLYFAQDVIIPLTLAALLSFLLAPLVTRLERWNLNRTSSVVIVIVATLIGFGGIGWIITNQFVDLAEKLPSYKENVEQKLQALNGRTSAVFSNASKVLDDLAQKGALPRIEPQPRPAITHQIPTDVPAVAPPVASVVPTPVMVVAKDTNSLEMLRLVLGQLLTPLGKAAIVIILTAFMLIGREELRDRLIRLAGTSKLHITTQALDDAGERVSRYLFMQLIINSVYGAAVAVGLFFIGVPNALMWGMLSMILRFIPYLGFWMAAGIPFLLALASPSWFQPVATLSLFALLELVTNNVEPGLYGTSTGLSSLAVLAAALFWGWLWGPMGLLLSTPLSVVLVVLGKHVPQLEFLSVVMSDEPVLQPHVRLYQRILATDYEEAEDLFEEFTKGKTLSEAYDNFVLPALALAESDYHFERIDDSRRKTVHDNMLEFVRDLGARREQAKPLDGLPAEPGEKVSSDCEAPPVEQGRLAHVEVICFPAHDEADEIGGMMLAQILRTEGVNIQVASVASLASEMVDVIEERKIEVICISSMTQKAARHARYLFKRIRDRYPKLPMVVALWSNKMGQEKARRLLGCGENDTVATTAAEATKDLLHLIVHCADRKPDK